MARPVDDAMDHGRGMALLKHYAHRVLFNRCGNSVLLIRDFKEPSMSHPEDSFDGTKALVHPGDLTASTVEVMRGRIKVMIQEGAREITLDLVGTQIVDSAGLGLMIQAHNSLANQGGTLTIRHPSEELKDLFRTMRLDKRFPVLD